MSRIAAGMTAFVAILAAPAASAQDEPATTAEEAIENARKYWSTEEPEEDPCADNPADEDVIVICQERTDSTPYMIGRAPRAKMNETATGAPAAPDVFGLPPCEAYQFCAKGIGSVPPPVLMVDFSAFPETPEGSDAARRYGGPTDADIAEEAAEEAEPAPAEQTPGEPEEDVYGP